MARSEAQLESTAYHEAGHAVAVWALDYRVSLVTIKPTDWFYGHIQWANPLRRRNVLAALAGEATPRERDRARPYIEHAIVVAFAGAVAQRRHNPRLRWFSGAADTKRGEWVAEGSDYKQANDLISLLYCGRVGDSYRSYLEARADDLVDSRWEEIKRLAAALLDRETLKNQEIIDAILAPELVEELRQMQKRVAMADPKMGR